MPDVDWTPPYRIIDVIPELESITGEKIDPETAEDILKDQLYKIAERYNLIRSAYTEHLEHPEPSIPKLYDILISGLLEPQCQDPTILYGHPSVMCPLAKPQPERPALSQRFELFVKGKEGVPKGEVASRAEAAMASVGLTGYGARLPTCAQAGRAALLAEPRTVVAGHADEPERLHAPVVGHRDRRAQQPPGPFRRWTQ